MPFARFLDAIASKGLLWEAANASVAAANASETPSVMAMFMAESLEFLLLSRCPSVVSGISRVGCVRVDAITVNCLGHHVICQLALLGEPVQGGDHDVAGIHLEVLA